MSDDLEITQGSGNIFADLGLENPEEEMTKARIVLALRDLIKRHGLTQNAAALRMGIAQPDLSKLLGGRSESFSLERLFRCLNKLGGRVDIKVTISRGPSLNEEPTRLVIKAA